jgi:hypothetical protein
MLNNLWSWGERGRGVRYHDQRVYVQLTQGSDVSGSEVQKPDGELTTVYKHV